MLVLMFDLLDSVRDQLAGVARDCERTSLDGAGARRLLAPTVDLERSVAWLKLAAVQRLDETGGWAAGSARSLGSFVAAVSGTTVGAANAFAETAGQVAQSPLVAAAVREGRLSTDQLAAIVPAAAAAPDRAGHLVDTATSGLGVRAIKEEAARIM